MQSLIEKYEKILQKPHGEPYQGYLTELVEALKAVPKKKEPDLQNKLRGVRADWSKDKGILENVTGDSGTVTVKP